MKCWPGQINATYYALLRLQNCDDWYVSVKGNQKEVLNLSYFGDFQRSGNLPYFPYPCQVPPIPALIYRLDELYRVIHWWDKNLEYQMIAIKQVVAEYAELIYRASVLFPLLHFFRVPPRKRPEHWVIDVKLSFRERLCLTIVRLFSHLFCFLKLGHVYWEISNPLRHRVLLPNSTPVTK